MEEEGEQIWEILRKLVSLMEVRKLGKLTRSDSLGRGGVKGDSKVEAE